MSSNVAVFDAERSGEPVDLHIQSILNAQRLIDVCMERISLYPDAIARAGFRIEYKPSAVLIPISPTQQQQ